MTPVFDVVVIGSGFGGSLIATILQTAGMSVGLIDKSSHPRFTIGESSTPAADFLLQQIAETYELDELRPLVRFGSWRREHPEIMCGCKRGFSYLWHGEQTGFQATPDHAHELLVAANSSREEADTQWYRPDVDHFFAEVAAKRGVELLENATVNSIQQDKPNHWALTFEQEGYFTTWNAEFLIDASGPAGVLLNHLNIPDITDSLSTNSHAVYSHFDHVSPVSNWLKDRNVSTDVYPYPIEDSVIHHLFHDGWMWQIRFENNLHSLGFVYSGIPRESPATAADLWSQTLIRHPVLAELLEGSQLAAFPHQLFHSSRLQRLRSQAAGPNWVALPFTTGFIDPLQSTGIAQTLFGVQCLTNIMIENHGHNRATALEQYSRKTIEQFHFLDDLISGCYLGLCDFRLFTAFSMLYFAAATTFEQRWEAGHCDEFGFLLANDREFRTVVSESKQDLENLASANRLTDEAIAQFCQSVEQRVSPWNSVGLFTPELPNLYSYTAAK